MGCTVQSAVKDAAGNPLRPRYRVTAEDDVRFGTITRLSPPVRVYVLWDDGEEELVRSDEVRHQSKIR
jgi:hypothetical protein